MLRQVPIPGGTTENPALNVYLVRSLLPSVFAQDVPAETATVLAATRRPLIFSSFVEPAPSAAWKTLPPWALVANKDRTSGSSWWRAGSTITRSDASHAVPASQPDAVVEIIDTAIATMG